MSRLISSQLVVWTVVALICLTHVPVYASATIDVYYAPEDQPIDRVVGLYAHATRYIYVSVYALTAPSVVKALVEAKRRGVDVRVITDRERLIDPQLRASDEHCLQCSFKTCLFFTYRRDSRAGSNCARPTRAF